MKFSSTSHRWSPKVLKTESKLTSLGFPVFENIRWIVMRLTPETSLFAFEIPHPRQLHSEGKTHLKRCQLENVRAPRIEEIVLKSLKGLLDEPGLLDHWLSIYEKRTSSELPAVERKIRTIDTDILTSERKVSNLVMRLSDLPTELSAEPIYRQMKDLNRKVLELKEKKERIELEKRQISFTAIDRQNRERRSKPSTCRFVYCTEWCSQLEEFRTACVSLNRVFKLVQ